MRNKDRWIPSKYVYRHGRLAASKSRHEVMVGSRLAVNLVAALYDRYIPEYVEGRLIDLGCGKVPLFGTYSGYVTDSICVDWINTLHPSKHVDCLCDINGGLPFQSSEFNTVILSDVLEHVSEPQHLFREMSRILKPKGKLLANVPFYYWLHEEPHDYYRYTEHALRHLADSANFRVLVMKAIGGSPEILADILAKHAQRCPVLGREIAAGIGYATNLFLATAVGRKLSDRSGRSFPFGYFFVAENCVRAQPCPPGAAAGEQLTCLRKHELLG